MSKNLPLLREEALRFRAAARHGQAGLWQPLSLSVLVLTCVSLCLLLLVLAATAQFKTTIRVTGVLVPQHGLIQVSPLYSGVFTEVHVREGDSVAAGQIIAALSREQFAADGLGSLLIDERYHARRLAQIDHELNLHQQRVAGEGERLQLLSTNLQQEVQALHEELRFLQQRLGLAQTTLVTQRALLERALIAEQDYQQQRHSVLALQQQQVQLTHQIAEREHRAQDALLSLRLLPLDAEQRRSELGAQREQWQYTGQERMRDALSAVVAPASGRVAALTIGAGDLARAGQVIAHVLPHEASVEALLYLPAAAAGRVAEGQQVILNYDAFPLQTHGVHEGEVSSVSISAVDPRVHYLPHGQMQHPVYLLRVRLPAQTIANASARGESRRLLPGMGLQADIVTAEMSILSYLLEPILNLLKKTHK